MQHQSYLYGQNRFHADPDLHAILEYHWADRSAQETERMARIGEIAGNDAYAVTWHVDRDAPPSLVMYDIDGQRVDQVQISPALDRLLRDVGAVNAPPFHGGSWHEYSSSLFMLADAGLTCMLVITGQVAYAIHKYAPSYADRWMGPLTDGSAWGATWFTEVQGGTDLGANTVSAKLEGDHWLLDGEKYFCSGAGLTDLALVTARPEGAPAGPKGVALFLVPRRSSTGELNFSVRRLKDKSATRSVPSGEVSFHGSEAWLVGEADRGIYYTLENLTLSRIANAASAAGLSRAAHLEVLGRVQARHVFGKALAEYPLIRRDLLEMHLRTVGSMALSFRATAGFDAGWLEKPPFGEQYHATRVWSHLAKMRTAEHALETTQQAAEIFGGIGFVEDYAIHRLHREAMVLPIWEGPANVQSLDLLEAFQRKQAHEPFMSDIAESMDLIDSPLSRTLATGIGEVIASLLNDSGDSAEWHAKERVQRLADYATAVAILEISRTGGERYERLAELYCERYLGSRSLPADACLQEDLIFPQAPHTAVS